MRAAFAIAIASLLALMGIVLAAGGSWLIALGGSWFYAGLGLALLGSGALLALRRTTVLSLFGWIVIATLGWALWEVGLDWWGLAARGGVVVAMGVVLLTPWIARSLRETRPPDRASEAASPFSASERARLGLGSALTAAVAAGAVSWFSGSRPIVAARSPTTQSISALSYAPSELTGRDMWGVTIFDQLACRIALKQVRYEGRFTSPLFQRVAFMSGTLDDYVRACDVAASEQLWESRLPPADK